MTQPSQNKARSVLFSIAVLAFIAFLVRQYTFADVPTIQHPPEPPIDQILVAALEEISDVDDAYTIPFTGSFCQNLVPNAPELRAEWPMLRTYQTSFIGAEISESLAGLQQQFAPLLADPSTPPLVKYLALTKTAWLALRVGDRAVTSESLALLAQMPLDGIRGCYQADIAYIKTLAAPSDAPIEQLHTAIRLNPLHVPALTQLVSRQIPALQNPVKKEAAFQDIVQSMAVLRQVSGAQIFATRLSSEIPDGSCRSAECRFIQALLYRWSNANVAAQEALQNLDSYCRVSPCLPELLVVSANLQKEMLEVSQ